MSVLNRTKTRIRRQKRVRKKIRGTAEIPRLCVFKSSKHIYTQIIDDLSGKTLVEASSLSTSDPIMKKGKKGGNKEGAALVGAAISERALKKKIKRVVFDRNGFLYHGRIKVLSEAARKHGLEF